MAFMIRYKIGIAAATLLLSGCVGAQIPIAMPQTVAATPGNQIASQLRLHESHVGIQEYKATSPLLYVTNYTKNSVTVYDTRAKHPSPIVTILDNLKAPAGDCIDSRGTLYVTNQPPSSLGWISEYPLGKTKTSTVVTAGINTPAFCAIDGNGNLWLTNTGGPNVTEYLSGSRKPHAIIAKGIVYPIGIAIDTSETLYVANRPVSGAANVVVYAPGSKAPTRTITDGVTYPVGIAVDSSGTLYVTNFMEDNIEEYLSGQDHPYRTITQGLDDPVDPVLNTKGWLYVSNIGTGQDVIEFSPGSIIPSHRRVTKGLVEPNGVAFFPPLLP
jgi:hypothetical protein